MEEKTKIPKFCDSAGNEWSLIFNLGIVRDLRDTIGFDFEDLQDGKGLIGLAASPNKFGALLWMLVEKQADKKKIDESTFATALDGEAMDGALTALVDAIVNFSRQSLRPTVRAVLEKADEATVAGMKVMEEWARESKIEDTVAEGVREKLKDFGPLLQN